MKKRYVVDVNDATSTIEDLQVEKDKLKKKIKQQKVKVTAIFTVAAYLTILQLRKAAEASTKTAQFDNTGQRGMLLLNNFTGYLDG